MNARAVSPDRVARAASAVATLSTFECDRDLARVAIPRPEVHLVVRFGPSTPDGIDAHALGARRTVTRKVLRTGLRTVMARIRLGATDAVLGVSAVTLAERTVSLEDLWGDAATRRLFDRLARARSTDDAARVLGDVIAERLVTVKERGAPARLALDAAEKLTRESLNAVALDLGVSERHLRRVFRETVGVGPKTFAKLTRFHRAVRAARDDGRASWASIAATAGYYDQAHLIAEFRAIAGVTPRALLRELHADPSSAAR